MKWMRRAASAMVSIPRVRIVVTPAEWNLVKEQLHALFEKDKQVRIIKSVDFEINPNSRYRPD